MANQQHRATEAPAVIKLLAHDVRWRIAGALAESDLRVQELLKLTGEASNVVSYHLKLMRDLAVVTEHRSAADGRDVYYSLDVARLHNLYAEAGISLHPGFAQSPAAFRDHIRTSHVGFGKRERVSPIRILFVCTHNSARSQMAEAILRSLGDDGVEVSSAGSAPGVVHSDAIRALAEMGLDIQHQRSKHLDEFAGHHFDYVVTLCDHVREACPVFSGEPMQIHWSFADPAAVEGERERYRAFVQTALQLFTRIRYLLPIIQKEQLRAA